MITTFGWMLEPKMSLSSASTAGCTCSDRNVAVTTRAVSRFTMFMSLTSLGYRSKRDLGINGALRAPRTRPRAGDRIVVEDEAAGVVSGAGADGVSGALRGVQEAVGVGARPGRNRVRKPATQCLGSVFHARRPTRRDRIDTDVDAGVGGEEAALGVHRPVGDVAFRARHSDQEDAGHEQQHHDENRHHRGDAALVGAVTPQSTHVTGLHQGFLNLTSEVSVYVCAGWLGTVSRAVTMMTTRRTADRSVTLAKDGAPPSPWVSRLKVAPGGFGIGLLAESK